MNKIRISIQPNTIFYLYLPDFIPKVRFFFFFEVSWGWVLKTYNLYDYPNIFAYICNQYIFVCYVRNTNQGSAAGPSATTE